MHNKGGLKAEGRTLKAERRTQNAEGGRQNAEGGRQNAKTLTRISGYLKLFGKSPFREVALSVKPSAFSVFCR